MRLRRLLPPVEIAIAAILVCFTACTASLLERNDQIPAVVICREVENPRRGGDFRYYLTVEFRDTAGVLNHRRIEVLWREYMYFTEGREACIRPPYEKLDPCRF